MVITNSKHPLISVAIITWNRCQLVLKAIESLFKQSYRPVEVVVVDSASNDGSDRAIAEAFPEVRVIRLHRNLGCPEGRNVALANCSGDIIFSLDDDARLDSSTLTLCMKRFQKEKELGIIACRVLPSEDGKGEEDKSYVHEHYTYLFSGGACAIRKEALDRVGYFPYDFFRQAEEGDLALRMFEAGYTILYYPQAVVYHERVQTSRYSQDLMFYGCRNELYTVVRRYPWFLIPAGMMLKMSAWNWKGIKNGTAMHLTLGACLAGIMSFPRLIMERKPVSLVTIRRIAELRRKLRKAGAIKK